jgi:DNA-binding transcriptional MocR family regulator
MPSPLYQRLAEHYRSAIQAGSLAEGDRMPSVRGLMRTHGVSLSTALQACRQLEDEGWLQARPRSGYFVQRPARLRLAPLAEPPLVLPADPAPYSGLNERVSSLVARARRHPVRVNLGSNMCAPELYPVKALNAAAQRVLKREPALLATAPQRHGHPALKAAVARRALAHGMQLAPEQVVITYGAIEARNLALRAVASPGDLIAVESPTYSGLLQLIESLGMRALEVPASPRTGLSLEALHMALDAYPAIKAVFVMPNVQNPQGSVMPDSHKERLVRLCEARGLPLIEDGSYAAFCSGPPLHAAKAWDTSGQVIHCASISKVVAPGVSLGWIAAGRWQARVEMLKYTQTRFSEEWPQIAVAEVLNGSGFERHLKAVNATLDEQRRRMAEAVAQHFPAGTRLSVPPGGLALWVEMPGALSSERVFDAALAEGIRVAPGTMFSNTGRFDAFLRLDCGRPYSDDTDAAMRTLGTLIQRLLDEG